MLLRSLNADPVVFGTCFCFQVTLFKGEMQFFFFFFVFTKDFSEEDEIHTHTLVIGLY